MPDARKPDQLRGAGPVAALAFALVVAFLGLQFPVQGQGARAAQQQQQQQKRHWIGTWIAAPTARADQPGGSRQGAAPTTNAPDLAIPPAVLAAAPGQVLPVGGQSPLHFRNQTLRQIAHLTLGGTSVRVVFSNLFGTKPLTIVTFGASVTKFASTTLN